MRWKCFSRLATPGRRDPEPGRALGEHSCLLVRASYVTVVPKLHMRRVPLILVACVMVFLAVVTGVLLTRSRGAKAQPQEPSPSKADYRIKEVHLQEEDRGRGSWQLDADYGEIFEAQGKTYMKKVTIRIHEPTREWTVKSDEGDLLRESKDVELRGNVVVVSSDGLRLETTRLNYMAKDQRVWTDRPVKIWRNGVVVQGQGFESGDKDGVTTIKGRVRATISRDQMARADEKKP